MGGMKVAKPLSKEMVLGAMAKTLSNRAAARYLSVSFNHYKKWAKLYVDAATGLTLFEKHKNQSGTGIPKYLSKTNEIGILDIIEGRATPGSFTPEKVKTRLIAEGYLCEECDVCKMKERRVLDYRMPLILNFLDKNKQNYKLDNLQLICYNCYFLTVGDVFTPRQIQGMEDHVTVYKQEKPTWELDEYHLKRLKELGLGNNTPTEDFISRV